MTLKSPIHHIFVIMGGYMHTKACHTNNFRITMINVISLYCEVLLVIQPKLNERTLSKI